MRKYETCTASEAAKRLGISRARIHQLIKAGKIPATVWCGLYVIQCSDIEARMIERDRELIVIPEEDT